MFWVILVIPSLQCWTTGQFLLVNITFDVLYPTIILVISISILKYALKTDQNLDLLIDHFYILQSGLASSITRVYCI